MKLKDVEYIQNYFFNENVATISTGNIYTTLELLDNGKIEVRKFNGWENLKDNNFYVMIPYPEIDPTWENLKSIWENRPNRLLYTYQNHHTSVAVSILSGNEALIKKAITFAKKDEYCGFTGGIIEKEVGERKEFHLIFPSFYQARNFSTDIVQNGFHLLNVRTETIGYY